MGRKHLGCWLTMWVSQLLSNFCPMSSICPSYVQYMSYHCPCQAFVLYLSYKSNICPQQIKQMSSQSNICPLFVFCLGQNLPKNLRTKHGHRLDLKIFMFGIWSHCTWTKSGQLLDIRRANICPLFVLER